MAKLRKHVMPTLSMVDKFVYWLVLLVLIAIYIGYWVLVGQLRRFIAFSDEMVVASSSGAGFLWSFVSWILFLAVTYGLWLLSYHVLRQPLFGLRNYEYKRQQLYPLFMRNRPKVPVNPRKKKERVLILGILLASIIFFPMSLCGRNSLHNDGGITCYNMFNQQVDRCSVEQITSVQIETYRYKSGRWGRWNWGVRMRFTTCSGETYLFEHSEFYNNASTKNADWLNAMLHLKERFDPSIVAYAGQEDLRMVIEDQELSISERALINELFGM